MTQKVFAFVQEHLDKSEQVALLAVTETTGSSPATVGQVMAVLADGTSCGTIGGGATEYQLAQRAAQAIQNGEHVFTFSIDHAEHGMVCGGAMSGYCNVFGSENRLYIFGGGHVAQSLAPLAMAAGFAVTVVEDRADLASAFSGVQYITCQPEEYEEAVHFGSSSYVVISTRGHKTDDQSLRFCLGRPLKYLGMIGSKKKVAALVEQLHQENYPKEQIGSIYAPIGLDIASGVPAEIAVSILAEMLLVKNGGSPRHKRQTDPLGSGD